jgi:apolipoprotein N-acyltransferase
MTGGVLQLVGISLLHLILSCATSIPYALIAFTYHPKIKKHFLPLLFASTLTIAEIFRALIISLLYYGKGTTVALNFTAGTIGNALSTTPLIEFAYFGGVFALTFTLGYLLYIFISRKNVRYYVKHILVIFTLLMFTHFFIPVTLPKKGTVVGIITTNFSTIESNNEDDYRKAFKEQSQLLHKATLSFASSSPTFIVYPEDTRYLSHTTLSDKADLVAHLNTTLFIDGDISVKPEGFSNISLFYYPNRERVVARGKELLLPFNEYLPFVFRSLFGFFIKKSTIDTYTKLHTFIPVHSKKTILFGTTRIGTLLCSEILSYSIIEGVRNEHPSIVFFQSRLNVFHDNPWFVMHLRSFTKITAAQLRTPLISSTSGAPSFVVSPYGRIERFIPTSFSTSTYIFK